MSDCTHFDYKTSTYWVLENDCITRYDRSKGFDFELYDFSYHGSPAYYLRVYKDGKLQNKDDCINYYKDRNTAVNFWQKNYDYKLRRAFEHYEKQKNRCLKFVDP